MKVLPALDLRLGDTVRVGYTDGTAQTVTVPRGYGSVADKQARMTPQAPPTKPAWWDRKDDDL